MKSYSERTMFTDTQLYAWHRATELVNQIPDETKPGELRCHEVARAVQRQLQNEPGKHSTVLRAALTVMDGKYGSVEHSWLELITLEVPAGRSRHVLLDVYSVGRLPMVQLLDLDARGAQNDRQYRAGTTRHDIDAEGIDRLVRLWGYRGFRGTEAAFR